MGARSSLPRLPLRLGLARRAGGRAGEEIGSVHPRVKAPSFRKSYIFRPMFMCMTLAVAAFGAGPPIGLAVAVMCSATNASMRAFATCTCAGASSPGESIGRSNPMATSPTNAVLPINFPNMVNASPVSAQSISVQSAFPRVCTIKMRRYITSESRLAILTGRLGRIKAGRFPVVGYFELLPLSYAVVTLPSQSPPDGTEACW